MAFLSVPVAALAPLPPRQRLQEENEAFEDMVQVCPPLPPPSLLHPPGTRTRYPRGSYYGFSIILKS